MSATYIKRELTRCQNCIFWCQWPKQPENAKCVIGDCRLQSPTIFPDGEKFASKWPSTKENDFCGEGEPNNP